MKQRPRLRSAREAPIGLVDCWIEELHLVTEVEHARPDIRVSKPEVKQNPDDESEFIVTLRVQRSFGGSRVDATIAGLFEIDSTTGQADARLIRYNAPAILYGILRGLVTSLGAFSRQEAPLLPSVNLAELVDRA